MVTKTGGVRFAPLPAAALAVFAAFAVSAAVSPVRAEFANPRGVAVVIGNEDYEHRDVPDVTFAHRDAEAFSRYVVEVLGYDPQNVLDLRDATRRELFDALGTRSDPHSRLWSYLDPDGGSDVVVFYSGHGVPGVNDGRGYLLPVDADPRAAEDDGYPIDLLYRNVGGLEEARSVLVYLDACFSGGSHEGGLIRNASPVYVTASPPSGVEGKVTSLAAASGKQVASWDERSRHGMFTHHLLDALYGGGDADGDGRVTASEAKGYLDRHMTRAARRQHRRVQRASLMGKEDVVLAKAPVGGGFPPRPALGEGVAKAEESKLGLTREQRVLVQEGLSSSGHDGVSADGEFDVRTREALGSWQESQGLARTGYLTQEQSETLQALGQAARGARLEAALARCAGEVDAGRLGAGRRCYEEARALAPGGPDAGEGVRAGLERIAGLEEDAAFALAKRRHTESGYREYLSSYPSGRYVSEARALLKEVSRPPLEVAEAEESQLGLTRVQRVLVQEGLSSLGHEVGSADGVFGRRTRSGIESYQRGKGLAETGYLTAELSEALQALGQEARGARLRKEEEADDEAFALAKQRHTESGYRGYLSSYPSGRHVSEARALLSEVTKPEWAPGKRFRDCAGCPELVVVPSGSFRMGSPGSEEGRGDDEGPVHRVEFARPFAVGVKEVTRGEFARFVSSTGRSMGNSCWVREDREWKERSGRHWRNPGFGQTDVHPAVCVDWNDAKSYVRWLSRETSKEYRLLSESEWEYVARAGTRGQYHFGSRLSPSQANYGRNEGGTVPVGSYSSNAWGLHDVHGNVTEWVEDCWNGSYVGAPSDGRAWESGDCGRRVLRGGSWGSGPGYLRSAYRKRISTGDRISYVGFRVARTLD